MFLHKISTKHRQVRPIFLLPVFVATLITITGCSALKGGIVISEEPDGTAFTIDFKEWSSQNKCELSLNKGDVVEIEIIRESGEIAFAVSGKKRQRALFGQGFTVCCLHRYSFRNRPLPVQSYGQKSQRKN